MRGSQPTRLICPFRLTFTILVIGGIAFDLGVWRGIVILDKQPTGWRQRDERRSRGVV